MTISIMAHAGFPRCLCTEFMQNAVFVKNGAHNIGTRGVLYEMMLGVDPDIHHIKIFGALAFVHVPVSPE